LIKYAGLYPSFSMSLNFCETLVIKLNLYDSFNQS
jgi:hypothetical protein